MNKEGETRKKDTVKGEWELRKNVDKERKRMGIKERYGQREKGK